MQDPLESKNQEGKDKGSKKRSKDKDGHHPHFGQRLSMAIGLSSLGLSGGSKSPLRDKEKDSTLQQIQRGRQVSVDSLSTIDTAHRRPSTDGSVDLSGFVKERRSSVISHFLIRPRVSSSSEGLSPKSSSCVTPIKSKGDTSKGRSEAALSHTTSSPYSDASATTSSASAESGHGAEQVETEGQFATRRGLIWRQKIHGRGRVSTSSEKASAETGHARALDGQHSSRHPQSIADIMESSRELHPHHPGDMERLELYHQLGLQEVHHNSLTGEDSSEVVMQQLYGDPSSVAKCGPSSLEINEKQHDLNRAMATETLTITDRDIPSPPSTIGANDPRTSSKRLGRFARLRFPSISISGIHKCHKHVGNALPALDAKRDHLLPISSQVQKSIPVLLTSAKHPAPYPPLIHASGSASTLASSVNTAATTHLGASSGSSNNSSVSSYSMGKKQITRQSLVALLDEHSHHPHHSSTSSTLAATLSTSSMGSCCAASRPGSDNQGSNHQLQQPKYTNHLHHPRGNSGSGAYKGLFGSERFTSSTTGNAAHGHLPEFGPPSQETQDNRGGFRSGLLRRTSRRTVSASHISSNEMFGTGSSLKQGADSGTDSCQCGLDSRECTCKLALVKVPFPKLITKGLVARDEFLRAESETGREDFMSPRGERSVGRYLFGSELKQMTFGDQDSGINTQDTHPNGNDMTKDNYLGMENTAIRSTNEHLPATFNPSPRLSTSTSEDISIPSCDLSQLTPAFLPPNDDPSLAKINVRATTRDGGLRRISDPMLRKMTSALSERHTAGQRTLSTSSISLTDHLTKSMVRSECTNLPTVTSSHGGSAPNARNMHNLTSPESVAPSTASSPSCGPSKKKEHGRLSVTAVKSRSSSPAPPSPLGFSVSGSSLFPAGQSSSTYTSSASNSLKSKFSISGITSHGHYHHVPFSSYLPRRPSISHTVFSSTNTPTSNAAIAAAATASSRSPTMLHLEPRSATADYSCSGTHYKRQRSMSLQDADLLTADQFIALMPGNSGHLSGEETPPKRRFSSEETVRILQFACKTFPYFLTNFFSLVFFAAARKSLVLATKGATYPGPYSDSSRTSRIAQGQE